MTLQGSGNDNTERRMKSPVCPFCRHIDARPWETCAAFPEGIPPEIWNGDNRHTAPYPGDHGIHFEKMVDGEMEDIRPDIWEYRDYRYFRDDPLTVQENEECEFFEWYEEALRQEALDTEQDAAGAEETDGNGSTVPSDQPVTITSGPHVLAPFQVTLSGDHPNSENQLVENKEYTEEDLEIIFTRSFGWQIKRITLGFWGPSNDDPYIILLTSSAGDLHPEGMKSDTFYYFSGGDDNQQFAKANRVLVESKTSGRRIYGFRQEEEGGRWKYIGILKLVECKRVEKDGHLTYEFKLERQDAITAPGLSPEENQLKGLLELEPALKSEKGLVKSIRKARLAAFSSLVKKNYDFTCAVCGKRRFTAAQEPEVEAAHIFPVKKNGSDDPRNGIALCRLHHWAFDCDLISIDDEYVILGKDSMKDDDNYAEIWQYVGEKILLPRDDSAKPHPMFLKQHRLIHGFD